MLLEADITRAPCQEKQAMPSGCDVTTSVMLHHFTFVLIVDSMPRCLLVVTIAFVPLLWYTAIACLVCLLLARVACNHHLTRCL